MCGPAAGNAAEALGGDGTGGAAVEKGLPGVRVEALVAARATAGVSDRIGAPRLYGLSQRLRRMAYRQVGDGLAAAFPKPSQAPPSSPSADKSGKQPKCAKLGA